MCGLMIADHARCHSGAWRRALAIPLLLPHTKVQIILPLNHMIEARFSSVAFPAHGAKVGNRGRRKGGPPKG